MNQRALPGQSYIPTELEQLANMVTHAVSPKSETLISLFIGVVF